MDAPLALIVAAHLFGVAEGVTQGRPPLHERFQASLRMARSGSSCRVRSRCVREDSVDVDVRTRASCGETIIISVHRGHAWMMALGSVQLFPGQES